MNELDNMKRPMSYLPRRLDCKRLLRYPLRFVYVSKLSQRQNRPTRRVR